MAESNGTTTRSVSGCTILHIAPQNNIPVNINFSRIKSEHLFRNFDNNGESFINLKKRNVIGSQAGPFQSGRKSNSRCDREINRSQSSVSIGYSEISRLVYDKEMVVHNIATYK